MIDSGISGDGSVVLAFGGEMRKFRLGIGQLRELQSTVNAWRIKLGAQPIGPAAFFNNLTKCDAWPDEIRAVIKLGLQGAGVPQTEIIMLIDRYVDQVSGFQFLELTELAAAIFGSAFKGAPDDPAGKKPEATTTSRPASPEFTASEPSSDSVLERSIN